MELLDFFSRANADYIDLLYQQYQKDPKSIDERWSAFFAGFEAGGAEGSILESMLSSRSGAPAEGVNHLVHSFRQYGHLIAPMNPLGGNPEHHPYLNLREFGFSEDEAASRKVNAGGFLGPYDGTLGGLVDALKKTYCGTFAVEYMEVPEQRERDWFQQRLETTLNQTALTADEKKAILHGLVLAEGFEQYLHTKYVGAKRFSLQGAEATIPLLENVLEEGARQGVEEVWMGMAHRGRLNVLANIFRKPYEWILAEFEGTAQLPENEGDGDVKYHLGFTRDREFASLGKTVKCCLSPNPSHLEIVNPVVEGIAKATQLRRNDPEGKKVLPVLLHGEAAFTGQGIVPETITLCEIDGWKTGGTIHVIINNQVGFTAEPRETRFGQYATSVAKMIDAPVFHVNGDDPEAVVRAGRLAVQYRTEFGGDVLIDVWCYRKYGHNETDDPTFTQPVMYQEIEKKTSVRDLYAARLIEEGVIQPSDVDAMKADLKRQLDEAWELAKEARPARRQSAFVGPWEKMKLAGDDWSATTAITVESIQQLTETTARLPEGFTLHPKLVKFMGQRNEMANGQKNADWGTAEMWAFGSLLLEGRNVRLTGQDVGRGTFTHRHALLRDFKNGTPYVPLQHLSDAQGTFTIKNSMLSELAVLGFEYGYSTVDPYTLVCWEAQFGDFVNGAQAVLDQFLVSGESKWSKMSGLTLLLPHGYEGQGPEHSSARLERFLQSCADKNMQVVYPSVPSQYFHILRRQLERNFRKPLVLMMPKSMLRDERSSSPLAEFTERNFEPVLDDPTPAAKTKRLLLCAGKVFFTVNGARKEKGVNDVTIGRVEQLYPFPEHELRALTKKYAGFEEIVWVQEEPKNMGAWSFVEPRLRETLGNVPIRYAGRDEAASPAHGFYKIHHIEEHEFVRKALGLPQENEGRHAAKG